MLNANVYLRYMQKSQCWNVSRVLRHLVILSCAHMKIKLIGLQFMAKEIWFHKYSVYVKWNWSARRPNMVRKWHCRVKLGLPDGSLQNTTTYWDIYTCIVQYRITIIFIPDKEPKCWTVRLNTGRLATLGQTRWPSAYNWYGIHPTEQTWTSLICGIQFEKDSKELLLAAQDWALSKAEASRHVPFARTSTTQSRAFSVVGPLVWNGLPFHTLPRVFSQKFLQQLKTTLFGRAGVGSASE